MVNAVAMDKTLENLGKGVQIAEQQRDTTAHKGFVASIFQGRPNFNLLFPWPEQDPDDAKKEARIIANLTEFLKENVQPDILNGKKDITPELVQAMADFGLFALKVPEEYGGKGLSQTAYTHVIGLLGSYCPSIAIMVSADNTIGGKYPVLHFGTPEQIRHFLPLLMKWPSAFCFTEQLVGSDPARMRTYALRVRNQEGRIVGYSISGEKWYATNSVWRNGEPLAGHLAVVVKIVDAPEDIDDPAKKDCFGVFIVPNNSSGLNRVAIRQRARFMGMPGIFNGILTFDQVYVAADTLIGGEGKGFKIAVQALNTGRIAIAGSCTANSKKCFKVMNWWANEREQWGKKIGRHELIGSGMLVPAAANTFAMEAVTNYAAGLVDRNLDCRLEAAMCKVLASELGWEIMDDAMQVRGGRGYESHESLAPREEAPPVDQMFVDSRPNRIFEGSTQILSQYVIREGLDDYLKRGKAFLEKGNWGGKVAAATGFAKQYLQLNFSSSLPLDSICPAALEDLRFVEKHSRQLAKAIIRLSGKYQAKMANKQLTTDRLFWIATELFAMTAVWAYVAEASRILTETLFYPAAAVDLAEMYCKMAKRRVKSHFAALWDNDDAAAWQISKKIQNGDYDFIQDGIM